MKRFYSPTKKLVFSSLLLILGINFVFAQIVINEYSCSNLQNPPTEREDWDDWEELGSIKKSNGISRPAHLNFPDNYGKYEDWIEIYNAGDIPVNIAGYYLSDKKDKPTKWKIPNSESSTIPAKGFIIVWASKRDTVIDSHFHSNFTLKQTKKKKESIVLSDDQGNILESIELTITQLGHSIGKVNDENSEWGIFNVPTPGASNSSSLSYSYAIKPVFVNPPGFYNSSISVEINANLPEGDSIYYTTDGSRPTRESTVYTEPVTISNTTVLKAIVCSNTPLILPGQIEYGTYFINENHSLVVVSVSADSLCELVNDLNQFIRPFGACEYFGADKTLKSKSLGEFNKHGQDSWACDQRSLDFIARDEMGDNHAIIEQIFPLSKRDKYQRLIFRSSGDDNYPCGGLEDNTGSTHMRDGYIHNLAQKGDLHLDVRASKRIILYVNGNYWGVYEVRENPDDHDYTKFHYKQDKYNLQYLLTWGGTWSKYGGDKAYSDWIELRDFILGNDMSDKSNYAKMKSQFNYKSLVDYVLVNSFTVCSDWLNYNVGWWRGLNPEGKHKKWGYILWDNDATFDFYINYTCIPDRTYGALPCNPETLTADTIDLEGHIAILNKLKENDEFNEYYINRQIDLLNTSFSSDTMLNYFDDYVALIDPEMTRHAERWGGTYEEWENNVQTLRTYIENRSIALQSGITSCYDLNGPYSLTLETDIPNKARIKLNSVDLETLPWQGLAYDGIPTTLKIKPIDDDTDIFYGWSADHATFSNSSVHEKEVKLNISQDDIIVAHFGPYSHIAPYNNKFSVALYPTITNGELTLEYLIDNPSEISVDLFDLSGRKMSNLYASNGLELVSKNTIALNLSGASIASGVYIVQISIGFEKKNMRIIYNKK